MANCMIAFPNRADSATLSGGAWAAGLPLANLQNRVIAKVARSATDANADTQFYIAYSTPQNIRVLGLVNHNCSIDARYRLRASNVSNFATTVYDSGWADVWPVVYPSDSLDWESESWWTGKYSAEEMAGYTTLLRHVLPTNVLASYWYIEIDDTANPAGYVQIGRLFIGPAWQPTHNASYGASHGWETDTQVEKAISGAEYFDRRTPYRVMRLTLDGMETDEAMARAFELQRRAGIDQEVLWMFDPADSVHALRRSFLGRMRQLSPIEYPYYNTNRTAFEIKELL